MCVWGVSECVCVWGGLVFSNSLKKNLANC